MNESSYTSTKRSSGGQGQIPAFGNWESYANELPITQYFESARQAGLIRYSSTTTSTSSGESDLYMVNHHLNKKPSPAVLLVPPPPTKTTRRRVMREKRTTTHVKEQGKQHQVGKKVVVVRDVTEPSTIIRRKTIQNQVMLVHHHHADGPPGPTPKLPGIAVLRPPKPVDEDLYKISPDLLHYTSKRKKVLGFFPRCLLPPCVV